MAKHDVVIEIYRKNRQSRSPQVMAEFSGTIDGVAISGEIRFIWKAKPKEFANIGIYTVKSTNKLFTQHPDYRDIRRQILQMYKTAMGGSLAKGAEEAIKR
jgi:hypothetical protein